MRKHLNTKSLIKNTMGKIIALLSAKGGVGKTTAAINIAHALNTFGRNIVLFEANVRTPHVGLMLGFPDVEKNLHSILEKKHEIKDGIYLHYSGLKVAIANFKGKHHFTHKELEGIHEALQDIKEHVELVVVDTPSNHSPEIYHALNAADYVLLITTPDLASVLETLKSLKYALHMKKQVLGVIVNRVTQKNHELSSKNIEQLLEYKVISIIPEDENIPLSIRLKHPITFSHPQSPSAIAFKQLSATLIGQKYDTKAEFSEKKGKFFYPFIKKTRWLR